MGLLEFTCWMGNFIWSICEVSQFVIVVINGVAVGVGVVIVAVCDFWIAVRGVRFGYIFLCVGLSGADMGVVWFLS